MLAHILSICNKSDYNLQKNYVKQVKEVRKMWNHCLWTEWKKHLLDDVQIKLKIFLYHDDQLNRYHNKKSEKI